MNPFNKVELNSEQTNLYADLNPNHIKLTHMHTCARARTHTHAQIQPSPNYRSVKKGILVYK